MSEEPSSYTITDQKLPVGDITIDLGEVRIFKWNPMLDMTAYELAIHMPLFLSGSVMNLDVENFFENLPVYAKRHWKLV